MNIIFWILVIAGLVLVWFLLSGAFKGIGRIGRRIYDDAKREINGDDDEPSAEINKSKEETDTNEKR